MFEDRFLPSLLNKTFRSKPAVVTDATQYQDQNITKYIVPYNTNPLNVHVSVFTSAILSVKSKPDMFVTFQFSRSISLLKF